VITLLLIARYLLLTGLVILAAGHVWVIAKERR
jgi:hypothetical protein